MPGGSVTALRRFNERCDEVARDREWWDGDVPSMLAHLAGPSSLGFG